MVYDIKLSLREDYLKTECIWLEAEGYESTPREDFERYEREQDDSGLMLSVHRDTGALLLIVIEQFREETEYAVKMLRDNPLPWTFSLASMGIKEKPLEDVLLAVWKKYKVMKMEWE